MDFFQRRRLKSLREEYGYDLANSAFDADDEAALATLSIYNLDTKFVALLNEYFKTVGRRKDSVAAAILLLRRELGALYGAMDHVSPGDTRKIQEMSKEHESEARLQMLQRLQYEEKDNG